MKEKIPVVAHRTAHVLASHGARRVGEVAYVGYELLHAEYVLAAILIFILVCEFSQAIEECVEWFETLTL